MLTDFKSLPQVVLQELATQDEALFRWANTCKVNDQESQRNAENLLLSAKAARNKANAKLRELLNPLESGIQGIRDLFRPYQDKLNQVIDLLTRDVSQYQEDCQELAREESTRQLIAQAEAITQAKATGEVFEVPAVIPSSQVSKTNHSEMGTTTYREDLDIQIENPNQVTRDLCEPSMSKIRARAKSGIVDIPGVLITKKLVPVSKVLKGGA